MQAYVFVHVCNIHLYIYFLSVNTVTVPCMLYSVVCCRVLCMLYSVVCCRVPCGGVYVVLYSVACCRVPSLPSGVRVITKSRRVTTTSVTPSKSSHVDSVFQTAPLTGTAAPPRCQQTPAPSVAGGSEQTSKLDLLQQRLLAYVSFLLLYNMYECFSRVFS